MLGSELLGALSGKLGRIIEGVQGQLIGMVEHCNKRDRGSLRGSTVFASEAVESKELGSPKGFLNSVG